MFNWPTPLYDIRVQLQEQSLAARQGAHPKNVAGALDEIGAALEKAIEGTIIDRGGDEQLNKLLKDVVGVVIASKDEQFFLWKENEDRGEHAHSWVSSGGGPVATIGMLGDRPVACALTTVVLAGHKLLMVDPTSQVVDYKMIDEWLKMVLPESAYKFSRFTEHGIWHRTDPTNFGGFAADLAARNKKETA